MLLEDGRPVELVMVMEMVSIRGLREVGKRYG